jgi:hypothetical protein
MKKSFLKNQAGNVAILLPLAMTAILSVAGGTIEYARWNSAQADLFAALDTSVLAGTKEYSETGDESAAIAVAKTYFDQTISESEDYSELAINFKLNKDKNGIAASGKAAIKPTLINLFGFSSLPLVSPGEAELVSAEGLPLGGAEIVEVSLMLDVTGSMCDDGVGPCTSGSKISGLKNAAKGLIEEILKNKNDETKPRIALVPFSTRVRLANDGHGADFMEELTDLDDDWDGYYKECVDGSGSGDSETSGTWTCNRYEVREAKDWKIMPCVTDRYFNALNSFDLTDAAPGRGNWLNAHGGDRMPEYWDSSDDHQAVTYTGKDASDPATNWNYNPDGSCGDVSNSNKVVPLTDTKSHLLSAVDGLEAYGATAGVLGTAFAWYTISPNWADIWGGASAPRPYSELTEEGKSGVKKLRKVAVLMTDGAYNTYRGWKDADSGPLNAAAVATCNNMKAAGIEVFTVGFELSSLGPGAAADAEKVLADCATDAAHNLNADSATELVQAFDQIAAELVSGEVRLVK